MLRELDAQVLPTGGAGILELWLSDEKYTIDSVQNIANNAVGGGLRHRG